VQTQEKNKPIKTDILGVYPEAVQTGALPERRFLKTSRALAITTIMLNMLSLVVAGFIFYCLNHLDLVVASPQRSYFLIQDKVNKSIKTMPYNVEQVSAVQLLVEDLLLRYLAERFTLPWDNDEAQRLWGKKGFVSTYSGSRVRSAFQKESSRSMQNSRNQEYIQEVHIYDLSYVRGNLWKATVEVIDLPVPDPFNPLCDRCSDNTPDCLKCKIEHAINRHLYTIYLRTHFGKRTLENPTGIYVTDFYKIYRPVQPQSPEWDLPIPLQKVLEKNTF